MGYGIIILYFIIGIILHLLSAIERSKCNHEYEYNKNIEKLWCKYCWKIKGE